MINIEELIREATKNRDQVRLETLRSIKTASQNWKTQKNAKPYDEAAEIEVLKKLVKQREESVRLYIEGGRTDLAEHEKSEIKILKEFLPEEVSEEVVRKRATEIIQVKDKKLMGLYVKTLKSEFPGAQGKLVADIVSSIINA